ncbi:hypothetical protein ACHWQZ_G009024 [Mnemiopsis leidyi]
MIFSVQVFDWQSLYQSQHIPIPRFLPIDESQTFIGRLARQLLNITNPTFTLYVDPVKTWYDMKSSEEVLNSSIFGKIVDALEPSGLQGLDRLYCFMVVTELQRFTKTTTKLILSDKVAMMQLQGVMRTLHPHSKTVENPNKFYQPLISKFSKFTALLSNYILRVGQIQILRQQISLTLHTLGKFESKQLVTAVETLNNALVANVTSHYTLDHVTPSDSLYEITPYLGACGLTQPLLQVYSTFKDLPMLPLLMFLHVQGHVTKLQYNTQCDLLVPAKRATDPLDPTVFTVGLSTILRQVVSYREDT